MIDLKLSKKNWNDEKSSVVSEPIEVMSDSQQDTGPDYPWGTQLSFDRKLIDALNLGSAEGGERFKIVGIGMVTNIRVSDKDEKVESIEIQLQKVNIVPKEDADKKMRKEVADEVWE